MWILKKQMSKHNKTETDSDTEKKKTRLKNIKKLAQGQATNNRKN